MSGKKKHFTETKAYKTFYKYLAGWGGAVVVIGAMFKILHLPGGGPILMGGMIIEAIIFAVSVFDPDHVTYHWERVYPSLFDDEQDVDAMVENAKKKNASLPPQDLEVLDEAPAPVPVAAAPVAAAVPNINVDIEQATVNNFNTHLKSAADSLSVFGKLSENNEAISEAIEGSIKNVEEMSSTNEAYISSLSNFSERVNENSESLTDFSGSIKQANESTAKMADANVGEGMTEYANAISSATSSFQTLADNSSATASATENFANIVTDTNSSMTAIKGGFESISSGLQDKKEFIDAMLNDLTNEYKASYESIIQSFSGDSGVSENMKSFNSSLANINSVFELQSKSVQENINTIDSFNKEVDGLTTAYADKSKKLETISTTLSSVEEKVKELDNVYGNMLSSIND